MKAFLALVKYDVVLGFRQGGGAGAALAYILSVLVMVPIALGPEQNLLQRIAPGILWLSLLLAVLLTAERIFQQDYEDGTLDGLMGSDLPLELIVLAKALAHWLSVSLPLAVVAPFLGFLVNVETTSIAVLLTSMVLGSFALSMLASIGGAVTAGLRRGGLLVALLVLPLYLPVLVFGLSAVLAADTPAGSGSSLLVLGAVALLALAVQPLACAAALRAYLK